MPLAIHTVTVIGAGTMGAAIAAHLANAGLTVYLLDLAPTDLTVQEQAAGLTLADRAVRNRIAQDGYTRMRKARPANLFTPAVADRIHVGNLEDDLATALAASDWVIEAIVEQLAPKQALLARLVPLLPPHAIVSTNTSGLPIHQIAAAQPADFQRRFLGTHFFNPPRYLPLIELIPTAATAPTVTATVQAFLEDVLGKGVVVCHDTPNFIANRMVSFILADLIAFAATEGYTVEEVDALTGPLLGRPRSATFRLNDIVGVDVWLQIAHNLHALIPHDDRRDTLLTPAYVEVMQTLVQHDFLGNKRGQGFYRTVADDQGAKQFWGLDLAAARHGAIAYLPPQQPTWPSVSATQRQPLAQRLPALTAADDRAGALLWHTLAHTLSYAAARIPEIADSLLDVDRALTWGYGWELGPFALWDALGVGPTVARMQREGIPVAAWVQRFLRDGNTHFYITDNGAPYIYDHARAAHLPIAQDPRVIEIAALRRRSAPLADNDAATLHDLGDGVLLLEFHTKLNILDLAVFPIVDAALEQLHGGATGLVIGNDGVHFSAGANLRAMLAAAETSDWQAIERLLLTGQRALQALRHAPRPVVAAPFQRALGGGAEMCLAAHRVVAHAETYIGLVETTVGLLPGWGGCKEMVRRHARPDLPDAGLTRVLQLLHQGQVSGSAADAQALGLLDTADQVTLHRGRLLHTARQAALTLMPNYTPPPATANVYAAGAAGLAALQPWIEQHTLPASHSRVIATHLAHVLCGGDGTAGWQDEQHFLDLERAAFIALLQTPATRARIHAMLTTGQPLQN